MAARLAELNLPDFGDPVAEPVVPEKIYAERLDRIAALLSAREIDALVIYGDREHAANIAYASGYDPRFEEAILVIVPGRGSDRHQAQTGSAALQQYSGVYAAVHPVAAARHVHEIAIRPLRGR
jgi:hypothetical protein